ncbi:MAG TPA: nonribosomal peptide synthetase MxaA [Methylocella sp.]|nr:nonribosomal peptide synthetase MxaA [Methylocella sp.]
MRQPAVTVCITALFFIHGARAATVDIRTPKEFGYFVGDLIEANVDIRTPKNQQFLNSSLPRPGPVTPLLDLRDAVLTKSYEDGSTLWQLHLTYQNFLPALDVHELEIPSITLIFLEDGQQKNVEVPSWHIRVAPLREAFPQKKENAAGYMRPDAPAVLISEAPPLHRAAFFALSVLLLLIYVLRDRAIWPFQKRPERVFSAAARKISTLAKKSAGMAFHRDALLTLHRSIEQAAGCTVLAEDLANFLSSHPKYEPLAPSFQKFFEASRAIFFDSEGERALHLFSKAELLAFASRLAAIEKSK